MHSVSMAYDGDDDGDSDCCLYEMKILQILKMNTHNQSLNVLELFLSLF